MELSFKRDKTLGYMYAYAPDHPLANGSGKVYEHVYVMCEHLGRVLGEDECVHHKDRDRSNNLLSNLEVMTKAEHHRLHQIEDNGVTYVDTTCPFCNKAFTVTALSAKVYCSMACSRMAAKKFEISREELLAMVWSMPTTKVAEALGVSDVAVAKRCKQMGITKPPRGFWAKVASGKILQDGLPM